MRVHAKRAIAPYLVLILIVAALLPFQVSALTWTAETQQSTGSGDNGAVSVTALSASTWIGSYYTGDFRITRTTDSGATFSEATILGSAGVNSDLDSIGTSTVVACVTDATKLNLAKSTDGGGLWGVTTITSSGAPTGSCSIEAVTTDLYAVAYWDTTSTSLHVLSTNNGGVSWSSPVLVATVASLEGVELSAPNATHAVVSYFVENADPVACRSSDSWASFDCVTVAIQATDSLDLKYVSGSTYIMATTVANEIRFHKSDDNGGFWVTATIHTQSGCTNTDASAVNNVCRASIAAFNETVYTYAYLLPDNGVPDDSVISQLNTTDAGTSWSSPETVFTSDGHATAIAAVHRQLIDVVITPAGAVFGLSQTANGGGAGFWGATTFFADFVAVVTPADILAFDATTTVSVTQLVGFDVDYNGDTIITRVDGGDNVTTRSAANLTEYGTTETDCTRQDGVFSIGTHVMFIDCDALASPQTGLITNAFLGTPSFTAPSSTCPNVDGTIDLDNPGEGSFGHGDAAREWQRIDAFPITYAQFRTSTFKTSGADCAAYLAWAFSTTTVTNEIGVAAFTNREGTGDEAREGKTSFGGQVDEICTFEHDVDADGTPETYLGSAGQDSPTRVYRVDFSGPSNNWIGDAPALNVALAGPVFQGTGAFGSGSSLGCAGDTIILHSVVDGKTRAVNWTTASQRWEATVTAGGRGTAITKDFVGDGVCSVTRTASAVDRFVAYRDGTDVKVAWASNGTVTANFSLPAGSFKSLDIQRCGQTAWAASNSVIAVYTILTATSGTPAGTSDVDVPVATTPPGGLFGGAGASVGDSIGVGEFGGNLFLGAVLMGFVSMGVATAPAAVGERRFGFSWAGAAIGLIIGFMIAWGFGFFTNGAVFAMVVLAILVIGFFFIRGRG